MLFHFLPHRKIDIQIHHAYSSATQFTTPWLFHAYVITHSISSNSNPHSSNGFAGCATQGLIGTFLSANIVNSKPVDTARTDLVNVAQRVASVVLRRKDDEDKTVVSPVCL